MHVVVCFVDFTKAFGSLNHKILLEILESKGVRGKSLELFTSYFADRTYSVKINDVYSKTGELRRGVPQGSVLGPKFFLFYNFPILFIFLFCQTWIAYILYKYIRGMRECFKSMMSRIAFSQTSSAYIRKYDVPGLLQRARRDPLNFIHLRIFNL